MLTLLVPMKAKHEGKAVPRKHLPRLWKIDNRLNGKQDGRLARAYFSPEYKNFDQHMQTVKKDKKRDYSLKSSFRRFFTNINSNTNFYIMCKRLRSIFLFQYRKTSWGNPFVFPKIWGFEKFYA